MREALSSLTPRGRAFLAGGVTLAVFGVLVGQTTLLRLGALVLVLPLVAALVLARSRYELVLEREVSPRMVRAGEQATVTLSLVNEGHAPLGTLLLEEEVPYALGSRPRFRLPGVRRGWHRSLTYRVRSELRGRHLLGPLTMRVTDPFGLVEVGRAFRSTAPLVVVPRTVALTPYGTPGPGTGGGLHRPLTFATGSAEDVTVREYRVGDDLRRVHWRSSARSDKLMVRREEQPWQSRATVLLDDRAASHRGHGAASSFETAVVVAASVATHLVERGYDVRLVMASGERTLGRGRQSGGAARSATTLLEALAVVRTSSHARLAVDWLDHPGETVVAVLGEGTAQDAPALGRIQRYAGHAAAFVLDVRTWTGLDAGAAQAETGRLVGAGWRAAPLTSRDGIDRVWSQVAR